MRDQRYYPRVPATFRVEYTAEGKTVRARGLTLGGGGLFVMPQIHLSPGAEINLRFRPAKHLPVIEAKARVCYHVPGEGTAFEYTEISPEHRQVLLRLIHHKTSDRRLYPRVPLATQIQCENFMSLAFSRDVSTGGMFVETKKTLPTGSRVSLRFHLDDEGPVVMATADVVYELEKMGIGVQFVDLSPEDRKRLEVFVASLHALPEPSAASSASA